MLTVIWHMLHGYHKFINKCVWKSSLFVFTLQSRKYIEKCTQKCPRKSWKTTKVHCFVCTLYVASLPTQINCSKIYKRNIILAAFDSVSGLIAKDVLLFEFLHDLEISCSLLYYMWAADSHRWNYYSYANTTLCSVKNWPGRLFTIKMSNMN